MNKAFKTHLREQTKHHIVASKKKKRDIPPTVEAEEAAISAQIDKVTAVFSATHIELSSATIPLGSIAAFNIQMDAINRHSVITLPSSNPTHWHDSIQVQYTEGKRLLRWGGELGHYPCIPEGELLQR